MNETAEIPERRNEKVWKRQLAGRTGEYCLLTAAYNEADRISATIEAVLTQTLLPKRWVIVSDGSVDKTDEIVASYANRYDFIRFIRVTREPGRSFGRKVKALHIGRDTLNDLEFEYIGNLDADITIDPSYFENLVARFDEDLKLGLCAGFVHELSSGEFRNRSSNRVYSVAHAAQLVRRQCYAEIGGYSGCKYGGEDWHAQTAARMAGWRAVAFPDLKIFHHRRTGEADNLLRDRFRLGRLDYCFGSHPLFEVLKCARRLGERPLAIGAITRLIGFTWGYISFAQRGFPKDFVEYLQTEQKNNLRSVVGLPIQHPKSNFS